MWQEQKQKKRKLKMEEARIIIGLIWVFFTMLGLLLSILMFLKGQKKEIIASIFVFCICLLLDISIIKSTVKRCKLIQSKEYKIEKVERKINYYKIKLKELQEENK